MARINNGLAAMTVAVIAALACPDSVTPVSAQISGDTIKIGLLTDMSGVYADISGQGGVEAIKMAIADSGGEINGKKIELTAREFQLLEFMMRHSGQVVTRTMLLEGVWDYHFDPQTNVIDVHISRLRAAIDKGFERPLLHTVRGAGYVLRDGD